MSYYQCLMNLKWIIGLFPTMVARTKWRNARANEETCRCWPIGIRVCNYKAERIARRSNLYSFFSIYDKVFKLFNFRNGGWCMHDEATTHYVDMIDQTTLGHLAIKQQFNKTPRAGWQIDPFGHSAVQAYLLGAEVHYIWMVNHPTRWLIYSFIPTCLLKAYFTDSILYANISAFFSKKEVATIW